MDFPCLLVLKGALFHNHRRFTFDDFKCVLRLCPLAIKHPLASANASLPAGRPSPTASWCWCCAAVRRPSSSLCSSTRQRLCCRPVCISAPDYLSTRENSVTNAPRKKRLHPVLSCANRVKTFNPSNLNPNCFEGFRDFRVNSLSIMELICHYLT